MRLVALKSMTVRLRSGRESMEFVGKGEPQKQGKIDLEFSPLALPSPMSMSPPFDIMENKELLPPSFFEEQMSRKSLKIKIPLPKTIDITLYFNDKLEVLKIINEGGNILKYLLRENPICPLIGSKIEIVDKLGEGGNAIVFDVVLKGQTSPSRYVAKQTKSMTKDMLIKTQSDRTNLREYLLDHDISLEEAYAFNGLDYHQQGVKSFKTEGLGPLGGFKGLFVVPTFLASCIPTRLPTKIYACEDVYSEYLLSLIVATFKRSGRSINFIDTFLFATCSGPPGGDPRMTKKQYTFMEKIDMTLYELAKKSFEIAQVPYIYSSLLAESLFIQTLHAIAVYQTLKIVHGDLHQDNVFIEKVRPDTEFNGQRLMEADFYEYRIGDTSLYLPGGAVGCEGRFLVKIADWGYGCKYSDPMICNKKIFMHTHKPPFDRPRGFETAYDMLFVSLIFHNYNWRNKFIMDALMVMLGAPKTKSVPDRKVLKSLIDKYIDEYETANNSKPSGRPKVGRIETLKNADPVKILTDHGLMKKFMKKPPAGARIVVLGTL